MDELSLLRRARDRMDRDYAQPLDVAALARTAHMSASHFSRRFRAAYGESPYGYLMTRRIERAKALLRLPRPLGKHGAVLREVAVGRQVRTCMGFPPWSGVSR